MIAFTRLLCGTQNQHDHLRYKRSGRNEVRPIVVWNCTKVCNLRCVHCYYDATQEKEEKGLSTKEAKEMIDDLAEYGVPVILFSGGEPLLRKDIFELGKYAIGKGLRAVLSTNGTLIDKDTVKRIADAGFSYAGISLDGLEKANDRLRGKKGAFKEALEGMKNCLDNNVRTGLRLTLSKENFEDLPAIFDLIEKEGIPRVCFYHLVYCGRGSQMLEQDIDNSQKRDAVDLIYEKTLEFAERNVEILTVDNHVDGVYLYRRAKKEMPQRAEEILKLLRINGGNRTGIAIGDIDHVGDVHPDQFWSNHTLGNVKERKFSEIWTDTSNPLLGALRDRKPLLKGRCARCGYLEICNGNFRARAEAVHGDPWAEDPACYLTEEEISEQLP